MGCYNSTVVDGTPDEVWAAISDFHDLSWAPGVIETCTKVGDAAGNQIGAKRVLNGAFHETLRAVDEVDHVIRYSIDDGPGPVAKDAIVGYVGQIRLFAVTDSNQTFVEWSSTWTSGSGEVQAFCDPVYQAVLGALKTHQAK